ncbi:MAG: sugar transferase [Ignavibacteria bacterium]
MMGLFEEKLKASLNRFNVRYLDFIKNYIDVNSTENCIILDDGKILIQPEHCQNYIDFEIFNRKKNYRGYFRSINKILPRGGLFIGCFESYLQRYLRIKKEHNGIVANILYLLDFIFNRVVPKLFITSWVYRRFFQPKNKAISKTEVLGRLYHSGFEVVDLKDSDEYLFVVARKVSDALSDKEPRYGIFYTMKRVGKGGKEIKVLKLRTMNPFAEFLQEYIYEKYNLKEGGKFNNDFRIPKWGMWLRKYWIDEIPMIINLIKGDIKLVGVRPLSRHYFELYPSDLKEMRTKYKPGLVPPFYADMPKKLEEIFASERRYFELYEQHPCRTDTKYLFKALYNIFFRKARSS